MITGRIHNILEDPRASAVIILDIFQVSEERHEIFGMPTLTRRQSETSLVIVPAVVSVWLIIIRKLLTQFKPHRILNFSTMLSTIASMPGVRLLVNVLVYKSASIQV